MKCWLPHALYWALHWKWKPEQWCGSSPLTYTAEGAQGLKDAGSIELKQKTPGMLVSLVTAWRVGRCGSGHGPASRQRIIPHTVCPGKEPNSSKVSTEGLSLTHHRQVERSLIRTVTFQDCLYFQIKSFFKHRSWFLLPQTLMPGSHLQEIWI